MSANNLSISWKAVFLVTLVVSVLTFLGFKVIYPRGNEVPYSINNFNEIGRSREIADHNTKDGEVIIGSKALDKPLEDGYLRNQPAWAVGKENTSDPLDAQIQELAGPQTKPDDPRLISVVKQLLEAPRPYVTKFSMPLIQTPQAKEIDKVLKGKESGFFIECGALDGERSSNSLWFETKRHWTGLLVEMDPSYYMQLRGKNRKVTSINACLSPKNYPEVVPFKEHAMGEGKLAEGANTQDDSVFNTYCFPLYTILLAMNVTTVDYFSLDVEGMEVPILKTIPFDKLDIKTFSVEYVHGKGGEKEYINFMKSKGYKMHKRISFFDPKIYLGANDFIFVKE